MLTLIPVAPLARAVYSSLAHHTWQSSPVLVPIYVDRAPEARPCLWLTAVCGSAYPGQQELELTGLRLPPTPPAYPFPLTLPLALPLLPLPRPKPILSVYSPI